MKSDEKLRNILLDIYQEMYRKAKPKANFKELMETGITQDADLIMGYVLEESKQLDIMQKHFKKNKLNKKEKEKISFEIMLGSSPRFAEKDFE